MSNNAKFCMLIILDGWGLDAASDRNAVSLARTPCLDRLFRQYPHTRLTCCGKAVGLPEGIMGNSEVGHLNIGAGRVVYQDLLRIDRAITDGSFAANETINRLIAGVKAGGGRLHLMGLVSDGGVHSQLSHLLSLVDLAAAKGVAQTCIHAILDGRDTAPDSGAGFLARLQGHLDAGSSAVIASVCGRYYAMDRDNRWDRIERAYRLYTEGVGRPTADPLQAVTEAYRQEETDEFVKPVVITDGSGRPLGTISDGDGVIFFNFRADRAREITRSLTDPDFTSFARPIVPKLAGYACMTQYDEKFGLPVAFPPQHLDGILGEAVSQRGLRQLRIAETEKYAHVTYFFNGGEEQPFDNEDRCLIPSPKEVATYDLKPEMSALQVTQEVLKRIRSGLYHLIVLNFANMDMVGHTGVLSAAIAACETVDHCVAQIVEELQQRGKAVLITADHGNAEKMTTSGGRIHTAHTTNPVPLILVDDARREALLRGGILGDIAPTILEIMGIAQPRQMTGRSLLEKP